MRPPQINGLSGAKNNASQLGSAPAFKGTEGRTAPAAPPPALSHGFVKPTNQLFGPNSFWNPQEASDYMKPSAFYDETARFPHAWNPHQRTDGALPPTGLGRREPQGLASLKEAPAERLLPLPDNYDAARRSSAVISYRT